MSQEKICDYGCGQKATHRFKNGKYCCSKQVFGCPNRKFRNPAWNKGLTKDSDERVRKYSENMKRTKNERQYSSWNKGLTKDTDIRIRQYSYKVSRSKKGIPNYKKRKQLKIHGISIGQFRYLMKRRLYICWVSPILERDKYGCTKCQSTKDLEVHHIIPYTKLFSKALNMCNLNPENYIQWDKQSIEKLQTTIINLHTLETGITVCKTCHGDIDEKRKRFFKK